MNDMDHEDGQKDGQEEDDFTQLPDDHDDGLKPIETGSDMPENPDAVPNLPILDEGKEGQIETPDSDSKSAEALPEIDGPVLDEDRNYIFKGDYIDLMDKVPSLKQISVGAGWDQKDFEEKKIDMDLSCFLLNKEDITRIDEDFIFYNNMAGCDGAAKHSGDNRTGAGDGDDESIFLDLNGIPFDVLKIMFVLSIYDEGLDGYNFNMVRNIFIRLVNKDDLREVIRLEIKEEDIKNGNVLCPIALIREGPKWYAEALMKLGENGLGSIAKEYGIIVREDTG